MLRIANHLINGRYVCGTSNQNGSQGVFLDASACPMLAFIPCTAPQMKTFQTDWASYEKERTQVAIGNAAPPGKSASPRALKKPRGQKAHVAGAGGTPV
jgi:hypothetical protein